jgi:integrase
MSRSKRIPSYRRHSSGQARVTIAGKDILLGKFQSPESHAAYARVLAELAASSGQVCQSPSGGSVVNGRRVKRLGQLTMAEAVLRYQRHAEAYYTAGEVHNLRLACQPVVELYGDLPVEGFGPAQFKAVRQWWLDSDKRSRNYVNALAKRLVRVCKWLVAEGIMPPACHQAIKCVEPLRRGRCAAREAAPVRPVPDEVLEATLPHLGPVPRAMVEFQRLTACRPGEVCRITPAMVDRTKAVWEIRLVDHKTAWRGRERIIYVPARAQALLVPFLLRGADDPCFSPADNMRMVRAERTAKRRTPASCGNVPGTNRKRRPAKQPGAAYTTQSYGRAILYACRKAGVEPWSPNQLRHAAATQVRKRFGLEAAQVFLGHASADVTQVYAEADRTLAVQVAQQIG